MLCIVARNAAIATPTNFDTQSTKLLVDASSKQFGERFALAKQQNQCDYRDRHDECVIHDQLAHRLYANAAANSSSMRLSKADRPPGAPSASFQASANRMPTTGIAPSHDGAANPALSMIEISVNKAWLCSASVREGEDDRP